ncbi:CYTH domain-containing protein [Halalkalibacter okhensis]|uniref:CYTH domain-containing protein n=1 Tax=Halalkalibacter okhensis TaxID=333138 RepID=A0A0B0IGQ9_9BACI|nr:CYTH domain-containing protein [Halalkalibacter okhensis]KHF38831.1 hypothetical protein LQ50_19065 [Halalkalibacter okhensis]
MSQEIEIEVKSMLTEEGYHTLINGLELLGANAVTQHNHYFETPDFSLKSAHSGLRIREKDQTFTLTLKQPHTVGKLETHQTLKEGEWITAKEEGLLPAGQVVSQLTSLKIPIERLTYVGTLTTSRIEISYRNGTLCLDKSSYLGQTDFEIEFEGTSLSHAESTLTKLLESYNLPYTETDNKVRRFFTRKLALDNK